jgi:nucleoid-associated protein YgaU
MLRKIILLAVGCFLSYAISGCTVRTYPLIRDRVDQNLESGNRGFMVGESKAEDKPRKTTRAVQVVELEVFRSRKVKRESALPGAGISPDIFALESSARQKNIPAIKPIFVKPIKPYKTKTVIKQYTVQEGDTLQSISKKFYGTSNRWKDVYKTNSKKLTSPNKIYPGQVINISIEEIVE